MATKTEKQPKEKTAKSSQKSDKQNADVADDSMQATSSQTPEPAADAPSDQSSASALDGVSLPAASGKAGMLGGAKDRGVKPDDKLALPTGKHFTYERVRSLNPKSFYCAMRWDYKLPNKSPEEAKRWWANKKILVTNPANGNRVVVRAVDFGPHENTGLTISLSPATLEALGIEIGGEVEMIFADQKAPTGVIE